MASTTHVYSRIAERRLRPIYDWLDSGNNKKAVQEADKVLKKQPKLLCAKVLKALALQRLGKSAECTDILENVCCEIPTDEATLQAITICYTAVNRPDKICEVYAAASKKDPTNEELLTHLFMSYVRIGDYRKQQQYAMSLYKLRPKNPYYFWAVMSVALQAKSDKSAGESLPLRLAEKMVSKFVQEGKIEAEQEVQLYLMILEMQGKYEEALDVIEGELGEKLKSLVTTSSKRIQLLMKLGRWKEANVLLKAHLKKNPDSWLDYVNYLSTTLKLHSEHVANNHNSVDYRVPLPHEGGESIVWGEADHQPAQAHCFLQGLASEAARCRGPHLALLELHRRMAELGLDPQPVVGDLTDMLVRYFERFGSKPICVADMRPYVGLLSVDATSVLMRRISEVVGLADGEPAATIAQQQQHISRLQLSRILGFHDVLTTEERLGLADLLVRLYEAGQHLALPDKLPTELSGNDPYMTLASHVLYSVYLETGSAMHIIKAIHLLEQALASSPSNFHFKLLLIKFYLLLGAGQQAHHYFEHLEMKHIQLDSMGYLVCTSLYGLGDLSLAVALYDASLKFFISNTNDSVDNLTYAYKYGSFMKIEEFDAFRDRLNDSLHYTFCTVEKMLHDLLTTANFAQTEQVCKGMEVKPGIDKIEWDKLRDNRDLDVTLSYEPNWPRLSADVTERTFDELRCFVRLRVALLKSLSAALELAAGEEAPPAEDCGQNGETSCPKTVLLRLVREMKELYEEVNGKDLQVQERINTPTPCRLRSYLKLPMASLLSDMATILVHTDDGNAELAARTAASVCQTVRSVVEATKARLLDGEVTARRDMFETAVGAAEMLAVAAVLCGGVHKAASRGRDKTGPRRRKKRDEGDGAESGGLQACKAVLAEVAECARGVESALAELSDWGGVSSEVKALSITDANGRESDYPSVERKLNDSYSFAAGEVKLYLQDRLTYIKQLLS